MRIRSMPICSNSSSRKYDQASVAFPLQHPCNGLSFRKHWDCSSLAVVQDGPRVDSECSINRRCDIVGGIGSGYGMGSCFIRGSNNLTASGSSPGEEDGTGCAPVIAAT